MRLLAALNRIPKQGGFTLIELLVVTIIIGISAAIATPNLLASQRKEKSTEVFTKIRSALVEAQTAANRASTSCQVTINTNGISGIFIPTPTPPTPPNCIIEPITFDSNVVSVTSTGGLSILYGFQGGTNNPQNITVAPKDFSGNPIITNAKCIVISASMIRTGIVNGTSCVNNENLRYIP